MSERGGIVFEKPSFDGTRFSNPSSFTNWTGLPNLGALLRWRFKETDHSRVPSRQVLEKTLPVSVPNINDNSHISVTWLGHATVLVRLDNITFLTDPVWSERASIAKFAGPKRYRPPPVNIRDLPKIDFAVISHNHFDHCDPKAIRELSARFKSMKWFVPLNLGNLVISNGATKDNVYEMNWGESRRLEFEDTGCSVWCLPAQHWSQRGLFDRYKTLWSGWAIIGPTRRFYFSGDTGYCRDEFDKIGRVLGPFDAAAISIGCYSPRWFMRSQHVDPAESVEIHKRVRSKKSFGIHWGTYAMGSYENYLEPPKLLQEEVEKAGIGAAEFIVLGHGETWNDSANLTEPTESSSLDY